MIPGLRRVWHVLTPSQRIQAWLLFGLILLSTALETVSIGLIFPLVQIIGEPSSIAQIPVLSDVFDRLQPMAPETFIVQASLVLVAVFVFKGVLTVTVIFARQRYIFHVFKTTASRLLQGYMLQPYAYHLRRNSADLSRTINMDAIQFSTKILDPIIVITSEVLVAVALFSLLLWVDPVATLVSLAVLGGGAGFVYFLVRGYLSRIAVESHDASGKMLRWVTSCITGIREMTVAGTRPAFHRKFDAYAEKYADANCFVAVLQQTPRPVFEMFAVIGVMVVVIVGLSQGRPADTLMPFLALLAATAFRVMPAINRVLNVVLQIHFTQPQLKAVSDDLEAARALSQDRMDWSANESDMDAGDARFSREISIDRLGYTYGDAKIAALDGISFTIPKGGVIGIVGPSGAGKSTLLGTLLGLLSPSDGRITVDGADIAEDLSGWRRRIGFIPQEIFILDGSIRDNIVFGVDGFQPERGADLDRVIDMARLRDVVSALPDGLDTNIGEHGARLSGGQRQRVIIARALYQNPEILIMDEATASLDAETEKEVSEAIGRLGRDMTIIIVAHRLSTVRKCDQLILLEDGRLAAQGTFRELSAHPGFSNMLNAADVHA